MSIIDIALIDDDADYCVAFQCMANKTEDLHLVGYANNAKDAITLIKDTLPDVVFLDNFLLEEDATNVMEKIHEMKLVKKPKVIVICSHPFPSLFQILQDSGADLFLHKDYGFDILFDRCRMIMRKNNPQLDDTIEENAEVYSDPEKLVFKILRELGVPAHLKGYDYLRRAILMATEDISVACSVTKLLYPDIARATNTSAWNVERAIRNAIQTSWNRSNSTVYMDYFKPFIDKTKGRPTNSEFISTIAHVVRNYCS